MGVVLLVKVKSYVRGFRFPAEDYVLNMAQIVGFCECTFKSDCGSDYGKDLPYVAMDMVSNKTIMIAGTANELLAKFKENQHE